MDFMGRWFCEKNVELSALSNTDALFKTGEITVGTDRLDIGRLAKPSGRCFGSGYLWLSQLWEAGILLAPGPGKKWE